MSSFINFKNCDYTPHPEAQQSSVHAMTFDELQNTLGGSGKDFGSMNMDELLKNVWTEERQTMAPNSDLGVTNDVNLQKQGSLTLPRTLCQKTVDEVWRELLKENGGLKDVNLIKEPNLQPQEKQPALGEMTLEDFLRKAGVVSENGQTQTNGRLSGDESSFVFGFKKHPNQNKGFHQQAVVTDRLTDVNGLQGVRSSQQPKPLKILPKQAAFNFTSSLNLAKEAQMGSPLNGVSMIGKSDHPTKSNLRPRSPSSPSYAYGEGGICGRNRDGSLEKVVERRRKRMIKNRESAARSRARKQAYTLELEAEVAKLKQLNHELQRKQEEIMESHNFQAPEKMKLQGNRKSCLRRTLTGPW